VSLRACYQLIACLLHRSHRPHTSLYAWTDAAKQRTMVYLSGRGQRGQMFLPPGTDNPSYATVSSLQCKCGHFSLPLYRKQERSLFTATLEQRSNVPTAHDVGRMTDHPAASNGRPVDLPYLRAGRLSHSPVAFPACVLTGVPRRRRPGRCPPTAHPSACDVDDYVSSCGIPLMPVVCWGLAAGYQPRPQVVDMGTNARYGGQLRYI